MHMRWPWVALSCVVAQEFVGFKKLSSRNQAQCIVAHVSFILQAFFFLPVLCLHGEQFHTTWPPRMRTVPPFGLP